MDWMPWSTGAKVLVPYSVSALDWLVSISWLDPWACHHIRVPNIHQLVYWPYPSVVVLFQTVSCYRTLLYHLQPPSTAFPMTKYHTSSSKQSRVHHPLKRRLQIPVDKLPVNSQLDCPPVAWQILNQSPSLVHLAWRQSSQFWGPSILVRPRGLIANTALPRYTHPSILYLPIFPCYPKMTLNHVIPFPVQGHIDYVTVHRNRPPVGILCTLQIDPYQPRLFFRLFCNFQTL